MTDATIWPRLIAQYRKRHALTQAAFAERFGVTQQTVSRWESATQVPHLEAQSALRTALGASAVSDSQSWIARVNDTYGRETLFDAEWRIVAISQSALEFSELTREAALGRRLSEFAATREVGAMIEKVPLFEGNIRALKVSIEILLPEARLRRDVDIWPIFTTDEKIFIHVAAFEAGAPRQSSGTLGTNVLGAQVVLIDGSILPIGGKSIAL